MKRRGQAATEFLATYGWAILILVIVISLIFSLNIFSPKLKNDCFGSEPISCEDVKFDSTGLTLVLTASGVSKENGKETKVSEIILSNPLSNCVISEEKILQDSIQTPVTCNSWNPVINLKEGNKFSGKATIQYVLPGSSTLYNSVVTFMGTVE